MWVIKEDLINQWESELELVLESEGAKDIFYLDEIFKKPEAYKGMITAFIQYKEAGTMTNYNLDIS